MQRVVKIADRAVGMGLPAYVIAEIGANHDQDLSLALEMISQAAAAGAEAVKFQSIRFDRLYYPSLESGEFREWFRQIELDEKWYAALAERARLEGVDFLSSPTYAESLGLLCAVGVPALKMASPQVQGNLPLLRKAAATGLPLIMSMGYSDYGDIQNALKTCREEGNENLILLHCVAKYPTDPNEARLRYIQTLASMTELPVGFSDHTLGTHMAIAAVTLGACVIEKHVTIDRTRSGPDHHFALNFPELRSMIEQIREVQQAMSEGTRMTLLSEEMELREKVRLKAVCVRDLAAGEALNSQNISFLRASCNGLGMKELGDTERYVTRHPIDAGTVLNWSDLQLN
jgi:N,N'-diacetyllegionaminate synthase